MHTSTYIHNTHIVTYLLYRPRPTLARANTRICIQAGCNQIRCKSKVSFSRHVISFFVNR